MNEHAFSRKNVNAIREVVEGGERLLAPERQSGRGCSSPRSGERGDRPAHR
jgi:hypothetical protein